MKDRNQIHICHFTSVHPSDDIRIFRKECVSLAKAGYKVTLVAPGTINEMRNGVRIISVGDFPKNRLKRMYFFSKKVIERAKIVDADIYHFHDPELLQGAWELIRQGKKVIYDAHEDVPKQILGKYWIKPFLRIPISFGYKFFEDLVASKLSGIISATPVINARYKKVNKNTIDINNFPFLSEFENNADAIKRENFVCYVGGITVIRGALEMVRAMENTTGVKLILAGNFSPSSLKDEIVKEKGWEKVDYVGNASREEVARIFSRSKAGLVVMHPLPNHIDAQPNKMFEYMSASLPVIGSDFELWKEVIEGNESGICVNPLSPKAIAEAILSIVANDENAKQLGENGRKAVLDKYNWESEEKKLIGFYDELCR
jgi:glycosyltransferase involved in cell wall biosynthesis